MTQLPRFLTPTQVVEFLAAEGISITEDAVRRWCREKRIAAITMPGGQWRIRREDVEAILAGRPMPVACGGSPQTGGSAAGELADPPTKRNLGLDRIDRPGPRPPRKGGTSR